MPSLESHLDHGEFKLKSKLHIKNWKKRSSAAKKKATLAISQGLQNFAGLRIFIAPVKFAGLRIWLLLLTFLSTLFYLFQICPCVIVIIF